MGKSTKPRVAKAAPLPGNVFEYWVPKVAGGKPLLPPPASPLAPAPSPGSAVPAASSKPKKAATDTPMGYLKDQFKLATNVPFGGGGLIGIEHELVTHTALLAAAIECGYGPQAYWTTKLLLDPSTTSELANHLLLRLDWIRSATARNSTSALSMAEFYERIEASEKVTVSFTLGSLFAYLCAKLWLEKAGEKLSSFLHTGIYTAAMGTAAATVPFLATSKKRPDFLVESSSAEWHVFESKGGNHVNRYARILQGLHQLHGLPPFGWASQLAMPARTVVCVHTSVDAGQPLSVLAVDPPASGDGQNTARPEGKKQHPVQLVKGVAKLLVILQTIEYFDALSITTDNGLAIEDGDQQWLIAAVRRDDSRAVAIPRMYKKLEPKFRGALATYIAAREVFDSSPPGTISSSTPPLYERVWNRISESYSSPDNPALGWARFSAYTLDSENLPNERLPFLQFCCEQLQIDAYCESVKAGAAIGRRPPRPFGSDHVLTTGGMLIGRIHEPDPELDAEFSRPD